MFLTRRSIIALGAMAPGLGLPDAARASEAQAAARVRQALAAARREHRVRAVAATLIVDGAPVWTETLGETGGPQSRPVNGDTIYSVQSTSKHMTATAVMLGVQRGLVDLDRPITDYLPGFSVQSRHEPEPERLMTLRLLLSHRAGFTHDAPVGGNFEPATARPDFQAHMDSIPRTWLRYPVGARYAYANLGFDVAGHVLEKVTGLPFPEVMRRWLFEPLGMARTTADADVYEPDRNRAVGHVAGADRVPARIAIVPSGGVYSSISDMSRYARFHLARGAFEGRQLLDRRLWAEMHAFRYGGYYALGVARAPLPLERRTLAVYSHNGGGFGFGSSFHYAPSEGVAWIVLFNQGDAGNPFDGLAPRPLLEARHGPVLPPPPNPHPVVRLPSERLHARVGLYMNRDSRCRAAVEDGSLSLTFDNGMGKLRLAFVSDDVAWIVEGRSRARVVTFHPPAGAQAACFELPEGDRWDFIDGPSVTPGPVGGEYDDRLGVYEIRQWGRPVARPTLSKRNGWLYYDDIRLAPFAPGLLASGAGEVVDLRGPLPTARNILLHRVASP